MAWKDVVRLVSQIYQRAGYAVSPTTDDVGPVDFVLRRGDEKVLLQCRHWSVWKVPDRAVHELAGYRSGSGVTRACMLTTGAFSDEARVFASLRGLELIDGAGLQELVAAA